MKNTYINTFVYFQPHKNHVNSVKNIRIMYSSLVLQSLTSSLANKGTHRCMVLSLGSLSWSIDLYFCFCASPILSLWHHESQNARPPCPSPTPWVHSNSCPSSRWCHPTISSSVVPVSSCAPSCPTSGSFSNESTLCMRWPKYWSFSFSISPSNEHPGLISSRMDWLVCHRKLQKNVQRGPRYSSPNFSNPPN